MFISGFQLAKIEKNGEEFATNAKRKFLCFIRDKMAHNQKDQIKLPK